MSVVQTRGGSNLVEEVRKGCSALSHGRGRCIPPFLLLLGRVSPLVQHRPRVTYSGTAKGPLLGGLPIVSGLEGVCEA